MINGRYTACLPQIEQANIKGEKEGTYLHDYQVNSSGILSLVDRPRIDAGKEGRGSEQGEKRA